MIDEFVSSIGITTGILAVAVLTVAVIILVLIILIIMQNKKIRQLNERCDTFMAGSDGRSLEQDIAEMFDENREIREAIVHDEKLIDNIFFRLKSAIQKTGVVKYDAFAQMGGMLSYACALLDENDNGVVINSVHSSDGCYSYIKTIRRGRPDVDLGAEEAQALKKAMDGFHKTKLEVAAVEAVKKNTDAE